MTTLSELRREMISAYGRRNRRRKAEFAVNFAQARGIQRILLVGVSGGWGTGGTSEERALMSVENLVEKGLLDAGFIITASGLEPSAAGWPDYVQADALDLPFEDRSFDLVYSNAVIEHVGGEQEQRRFVAEHARVGRHWVLTTPNRWCPVESHTGVFIAHWRRSWADQTPAVSRLLGPRDLRDLLPPMGRVFGNTLSPTLTAASV